MAAAGATALWTGLVAWSPPEFFAVAALFSAAWIAPLATAAPPGLLARLRPTAADVLLGLVAGAALYGLTRAFLWVTCGGLSEALCRPMVEMYVRFETRAPFPALALLLLIAPAEELFWRGVVQAHLEPRIGAAPPSRSRPRSRSPSRSQAVSRSSRSRPCPPTRSGARSPRGAGASCPRS